MKILFIAKNIPTPRKRENDVIMVIADLLKVKHEVDVVYPSEYVPYNLRNHSKYKFERGLKSWNEKRIKVSVFKYVRLPIQNSAFNLLPISFKFSKCEFLKSTNFEYDIVHAHYILPDGLIAYQLFKKFGVKYVVTVRGSDIRLVSAVGKESRTYEYFKMVLEYSSCVTCLNHHSAHFIENEFCVQVEVIPHGIEKSLLNYNHMPDPVIVCVANFNPDKRIDWVIRAFIEYQGLMSPKLYIIGAGKEEAALRKLAGDDECIKFLGRISRENVLEVLDKSSIFAMPSKNESFGRVYLEAAARGNAIIATADDGIFEIFKKEKEMFYCSSYFQFKSIFVKLIDDSDSRASMSKAAFNRVKFITWDQILEKYERIYSYLSK